MKARRTHGKARHLALPTFLLLSPSVYLLSSVFFVRAHCSSPFLQSSMHKVFGRSSYNCSKRVVFLRGFRGLSHERVHGGKDLGSKWECVGPVTLA